MTKLLLALISPGLNALLLYRGYQFYGWLAEWLLESKVDRNNAFEKHKAEVLGLAKLYGDVNSLLSGLLVAIVSALVFSALDPRWPVRLLLPLAYFALAFRISVVVSATRKDGELGGYGRAPETTDSAKAKIRRLRLATTIMSGIPAAIALIDATLRWVGTQFTCLSPVTSFLTGS